MNRVKTVLLLGALTGLFIFVGGYLGGKQGMVIAFVAALAMNFISYWKSDKIVLGMYKARPITREQAPEIYDIVAELAQTEGLPMPRVAVIDNPTPNAFATGRNPENAVVAVTSGIVDLLDRRELRGVLAHELGHVLDRDILISSVAATITGAVMMLASMARFGAMFGGSGEERRGGGLGLLLISILAPLGAMLIQMAISRSREFLADREGSEMSRDPMALASALQKLESANQRRPMQEATPHTAHLFIVNPLSGGGLAKLFSTHPPIPERVARLQEIARDMGSNPPTPPSESTGFIPPPPPPPPPSSPGGHSGRGKVDWS